MNKISSGFGRLLLKTPVFIRLKISGHLKCMGTIFTRGDNTYFGQVSDWLWQSCVPTIDEFLQSESINHFVETILLADRSRDLTNLSARITALRDAAPTRNKKSIWMIAASTALLERYFIYCVNMPQTVDSSFVGSCSPEAIIILETARDIAKAEIKLVKQRRHRFEYQLGNLIIGICDYHLDNRESAIKHLTEASQGNPSLPWALVLLARLNHYPQDIGNEVTQADANLPSEFYRHLGNKLANSDDWQNAAKAFNQSIDAQPGDLWRFAQSGVTVRDATRVEKRDVATTGQVVISGN